MKFQKLKNPKRSKINNQLLDIPNNLNNLNNLSPPITEQSKENHKNTKNSIINTSSKLNSNITNNNKKSINKSYIYLTVKFTKRGDLEKKKIDEMFKRLKNKEHRINKLIFENTSRLMIILIVCELMVCVITDNEYSYSSFAYIALVKNINGFYKSCFNNNINYNNNINNNNYSNCYKLIEREIKNNLIEYKRFPIIQIKYNNTIVYRNNNYTNDTNYLYRRDYFYLFYKNYENLTKIMVNKKNICKIESIIYLSRFVFVVIFFSLLIYTITGGVDHLLFEPLNKLEKLIDKVSKDPVNIKALNELKKKKMKKVEN